MTADRSVLDRPGPPPARTTSYGALPHQVYEVHEPADGHPRAWVVLVHGGFWRAEWDRTHLRPLAAALCDEGYAVALVEYARSGSAPGWPATGDDVRAALAAVRREAGHGPVGPSPVVLVGHSAGGHLAVWALHQPEARPAAADAPVRGAVSLAGCLDLHLVHELDLDEGAARDLLGSTPQTDPATWEGADPTRLGRTACPVVAVHGDADEKVPLEVTRSWWRRAATAGRDRLVVLPGVSHFTLIDPGAHSFPTLLAAVQALLDGG